MKTSTLLKTLSAVGILGTALFSVNAYAEGGCPSGSVPQRGQGWQTCIPMSGGSSGSKRQTSAETRMPSGREMAEMADAFSESLMVVVVDKKTDKIYAQNTIRFDSGATGEALERQCRQAGGDCDRLLPFDTRCATVIKTPTTETKGFFIFRKEVPSFNYSIVKWNTLAEKKNKFSDQYPQIYKDLQLPPETIVKDICKS